MALTAQTYDWFSMARATVSASHASMRSFGQLAVYINTSYSLPEKLRHLYRTFDKHEDITHQGYLMQTGIVPVDPADTRTPDMLIDAALPRTAMEYLDKMQALCEQYGAELVLIKAPTNSVKYYWYDEWDAQIVDYAAANNLSYYNFIGKDEELGLDWSRDTYDAGLHLNVYGAEKWTVAVGELLKAEHGVPDRRGDAELDALWEQRIDNYHNEKQRGESAQ